MDNLLFTTGIKYTFEEFCLLNDAVSKTRKKNIGFHIVLLIPIVCLVVQMIVEEKYINLVVVAIIYFLIWGTVEKNMLKSLRMRIWKDSDECDDIWYYGFFEDYMEQTTKKSVTKVYYNRIYEIIETETHFYPMIGKNNGFLIRKENCRPELIAFLQEKARELKK